MRLRVLVMNLRDRAVLGRFIVEAPSIGALMESGEIRRRVGDRHYDHLAVYQDEQAEPRAFKCAAGDMCQEKQLCAVACVRAHVERGR
jgi:hypothetical protein